MDLASAGALLRSRRDWARTMSFLPVGWGEAVFRFSCSGITDSIICTLGYLPDPAMSPANQALNVAKSWGQDGVAARPITVTKLGTAWKWDSLDITFMTATGPQIASQPVNMQGAGITNTPPPNCCVLLRKSTVRGGRQGRGRMYLPAGLIAEANVTDAGAIPGATLATMQTSIDNALAQMATNNVPPELLHSTPTPLPDHITAMTVQTVIGTQRRRLR